MRALFLIGWVALWVASTAWAQESDLQTMDAARDALKRKDTATKVMEVDQSWVNAIEVTLYPNRISGVSDSAPEPLTIYIKPGDAGFDAILSALKSEAAIKEDKAALELESATKTLQERGLIGAPKK